MLEKMGCQFGISYISGSGGGRSWSCKAVCEGSIVTKISDIQTNPSHHSYSYGHKSH